jgi:UDP-N-acetylmuramate--alanine ligase
MFSNQKIHFVGIGGSGMNGIAEVLINMGHHVTGSDMKASSVTERLESLGGVIHIGHDAFYVHGVDVVVRSTAIPDHNVEVIEAFARQIPVIPRAEMLAELMRMKYGIAIAGTHGKTTTTSLLASCLYDAKFDPTVVIGGKLNMLDSSARLGEGDYMVAEADESDGSFLLLNPTISVITNIDPEHLEYWKTEENLIQGFTTFAQKVPFFGFTVLCLDHPVVQSIIPHIRRKICTYGLSTQADVRAVNVQREAAHTTCTVLYKGTELGALSLHLPGIHNLQNALATVSVALGLHIPFSTIQNAIQNFKGVQRRFTIVYDTSSSENTKHLTFIDDYAHHPVEIQATLSGAMQAYPTRRKIALFQPHRYSRVQNLYGDFCRSFNDVDVVLVLPIYAAGEKEGTYTHEDLYRGILQHGHRNVYQVSTLQEGLDWLQEYIQGGDVVLSLGAGNVNWLVYALRDFFLQEEQEEQELEQ